MGEAQLERYRAVSYFATTLSKRPARVQFKLEQTEGGVLGSARHGSSLSYSATRATVDGRENS